MKKSKGTISKDQALKYSFGRVGKKVDLPVDELKQTAIEALRTAALRMPSLNITECINLIKK